MLSNKKIVHLLLKLRLKQGKAKLAVCNKINYEIEAQNSFKRFLNIIKKVNMASRYLKGHVKSRFKTTSILIFQSQSLQNNQKKVLKAQFNHINLVSQTVGKILKLTNRLTSSKACRTPNINIMSI